MTRTLTLPLRVVSEANRRDHWSVKAKRVRAQRSAVAYAWTGTDMPRGRQPSAVRLTRVAPRKLDDDNLVRGCKAIRDEVAWMCGFDDASPATRWEYAQERGPYAVRVSVEWP